MASSYKEAEEVYTALTTECVCLRESCCSINRQLLELHTNFSHVHSQVDQLERLVYNHPNRQHAYMLYLKTFDKLHKGVIITHQGFE